MNQDEAIHEICLYGMFDAATHATNGRYTYFCYPDDIASQKLCEYTLIPTHMHDFFQAEEFERVVLTDPFDFTKRMPTPRLPAGLEAERPGSFDSIHVARIRSEMQAHYAPSEAFDRLDLAG